MIKIFSGLWLFVLLAIAACNGTAKIEPASNELTVMTVEKVKLADLGGQLVDLSKYRGKTVFINFWATWCKPCVQEMPSLQRMTEKLKGGDMVFLFASDETQEEIEQFKNVKGYTMDFVRAESLADLNIMGLPTTFIFDTNGRLAFSEMGAREWDSEESITMITKIIKQ